MQLHYLQHMPDVPLACEFLEVKEIFPHADPQKLVLITVNGNIAFKRPAVDLHLAVIKRVIKGQKACKRYIVVTYPRFLIKLTVGRRKVLLALFNLAAHEVQLALVWVFQPPAHKPVGLFFMYHGNAVIALHILTLLVKKPRI